MLDDVNSVAQQRGMDGPSTRCCRTGVVDVHRVDTDKRDPAAHQELGRGLGQEWCVVAVGLGAEVPVPAGVDQHRTAGFDVIGQLVGNDGARRNLPTVDDDRRQVHQGVQVEAGQVGKDNAASTVTSSAPKPPRAAGEKVVDEGEGGNDIAKYLVAQKLI